MRWKEVGWMEDSGGEERRGEEGQTGVVIFARYILTELSTPVKPGKLSSGPDCDTVRQVQGFGYIEEEVKVQSLSLQLVIP